MAALPAATSDFSQHLQYISGRNCPIGMRVPENLDSFVLGLPIHHLLERVFGAGPLTGGFGIPCHFVGGLVAGDRHDVEFGPHFHQPSHTIRARGCRGRCLKQGS
jgi:hypothetical protein